jgi:hypothetical protein
MHKDVLELGIYGRGNKIKKIILISIPTENLNLQISVAFTSF